MIVTIDCILTKKLKESGDNKKVSLLIKAMC